MKQRSIIKMQKLVLKFIGVLLLLFACNSQAETDVAPVTLDDLTYDIVDLAPHTRVLFDPKSKLSIDEVRQSSQEFKPVTTRYIEFGLQEGITWLTFKIVNTTTESDIWRLDLRRQRLRIAEVFVVPQSEAPKLLLSSSHHDRFRDRPVASRFLAIDIPMNVGQTLDVYVRYATHETTWLPMQLSRLAPYSAYHAVEERINWSVNGALLAMMTIAIVVGPIVGWRTSLALCCYIFAGGFFVFHAGGYTAQVLWPDASGTLNEPLGLTTMLAMAFSGPLFARALFDTAKTLPKLDFWLRLQLWVIVIFILLSLPLHEYVVFRVIAYPLIVIVAVVQLITGVMAKRAGLIGATPFLTGASLVSLSLLFALAAHVFSGEISLEHTLDFGQLTLLSETIAFATAVVMRTLRLRKQRDKALQAELTAAQEKIQLTEALLDTQQAYGRAQNIANQRQEQLSSLGHDIRQPLTALRLAVTKLASSHNLASLQLQSAFDYFEELARSHSAASKNPEDQPATTSLNEAFELSVVMDNVYEMFREEAAGKGLDFRYRCQDFSVNTNPIALMRMVNNLVSNAIKYTDDGGILLAARQRQNEVRIEVCDTGFGMDETQLTAVMGARVKGSQSDGDGLGLHIVAELAKDLGLTFNMQSRPEHGTCAFISLPLPTATLENG